MEAGRKCRPQFADDLRSAQEAEQAYLRTGDGRALDGGSILATNMEHRDFGSALERFRLAAFNNAGGIFLRRYWAGGEGDDLDRALDLWQAAVEATPPGWPGPAHGSSTT